MWNSYVRSPTFVTWETSNDRFTILEPVLSIASKRWVTHYPRVTKNEKQTWPTFATINQNKQGAFTSLKGYIYIYGVHLGLLPQTSPGGLCLWVILVFCLWLYLFYLFKALASGYFCLYLFHCACIFNSFGTCAQVLYSSFLTCIGPVPTYSIPLGYMHK